MRHIQRSSVSQAAAPQDDLRRARIEPCAWVLQQVHACCSTQDPLPAVRLAGERKQMERMEGGMAKRIFVLPWMTRTHAGSTELAKLVAS